jgi:hypothetical protein
MAALNAMPLEKPGIPASPQGGKLQPGFVQPGFRKRLSIFDKKSVLHGSLNSTCI